MAKKDMEVVKGVDLARYMGRWYEIASFPFRTQPKNAANTWATYTLKEGGTVNVLNETWTSDGKTVSIEETAYKADPNSDETKLKVKFYLPPFLPILPNRREKQSDPPPETDEALARDKGMWWLKSIFGK